MAPSLKGSRPSRESVLTTGTRNAESLRASSRSESERDAEKEMGEGDPEKEKAKRSRDEDLEDEPGLNAVDREEEELYLEVESGPSDESLEDKAFEVTWNGDSDPESPRQLSKLRKWIIVMVVATASLCVTCVSSMYTSTYNQITVEFGCSRIVATLGLSIYVVGLGIGPMILSPLSEFFGRRWIYIYSFIFFTIWLIPCAVAQNIQTMLISRFFDGLAGSAFLSVAGGTVGDLFAKHELGLPMMIYTASPFVGPEIGPLVGGFINTRTTWRWTFYSLIAWSGLELLMLIFLVPETYAPALLRAKAARLRKETGEQRWWAKGDIRKGSGGRAAAIGRAVAWSCMRPFQMLTLEVMCLNLCILSAILLGILYLFFGAFVFVFREVYGFSLEQTGITFLGIMVGMLIGISTDPFWRRNYQKLVKRHEAKTGIPGSSEPEFRLPPTIVGAWIVPFAMFGFAWTTFSSVHWMVPIMFSGFFGLGVILTYTGVFTFLVDCYPLYGASALAANSFARSMFAAAFPLFGVQMYEKLGIHWASSLLAFLALAMAPFPLVFYRYGKRLRGRSRFATS
ncbi:MFS general substrate transporter [Trichodelitschia bisporula]|uniref:MFS general substrate transporter n=1 Tax=Trichodelitschia bisporula TaxID=703511 RepID=A0A6G1HLL4_9PEZI|nr:MFS general substrate transporter [Trichodelitschia bisporula]